MGFRGPGAPREPRLRRHRTGALPHRHPGALRPRRRPDSVRDPDTEVVAQANWQRWRDDNERLPATGPPEARSRSPTPSPGASPGSRRSSAGSCRARAPHRGHPRRGHPDPEGRRTHAGTDRHAGRGDHRLDGGLAARRADMSVRQRLRRTRSHPEPGDHARRPLPRCAHRDRHHRGASAPSSRTSCSPVTSGRSAAPSASRPNSSGSATRSATHDATVAGMNAGRRPHPDAGDHPAGRTGGGGRATARWPGTSGRSGRTTRLVPSPPTAELYPVDPSGVSADLVDLAGAEAIVDRAQAHLDAAAGWPVAAIQLAELVTDTARITPAPAGCLAHHERLPLADPTTSGRPHG